MEPPHSVGLPVIQPRGAHNASRPGAAQDKAGKEREEERERETLEQAGKMMFKTETGCLGQDEPP